MQLIADRLLSYVRSTLSYIPVTLSIGGALYEGDITGYDSEALTKEADTALYKSKENGRDRSQASQMKRWVDIGFYVI